MCVCVCVNRKGRGGRGITHGAAAGAGLAAAGDGGAALGAGGVGVDEGLHGCGLLFASLLWWMGI